MIAVALMEGCSASRMGMNWVAPKWLVGAAKDAALIVLSDDDESLMRIHEDPSSPGLSDVAGTPVQYSRKLPTGWGLLITREDS